MSKVSRRSMIAMAAVAPTTGMAASSNGAELDPASFGVLIRLAFIYVEGKYQWATACPDHIAMKEMKWRPGWAVPYKWISLTTFLKELEIEFNLTS